MAADPDPRRPPIGERAPRYAREPLPEPPPQITARSVSLGEAASLAAASLALADAVHALRDEARDPSAVTRFEIRIGAVDPLAWLAAQPDEVRLYWEDRDGERCFAGVGLAMTLDGTDFGVLTAAGADLPWMFSGRFDPARPPAVEWERFGAVRCYLPAIELSRCGEAIRLACHVAAAEGSGQQVAGALRELRQPGGPRPIGRLEASWGGAMKGSWADGVGRVLQRIRSRELQKAVLARRVRLRTPDDLCAVSLLQALSSDHPETFRFCLQLERDAALVGASPELLYRRRSHSVQSDALAGTRPRGTDDDDDRRLAAELHSSRKEEREHQLVCEHVQSRLTPLCSELRSADQPTIRRLSNVQHLRTEFAGTLRDGVTDAEILTRLHPTPAVCGLPAPEALAEIAACEDFDRGLYGGPIGWLGPDEAHCAVAIRCGLLNRRELSIYAGAGIVEGSSAATEWDETVSKLEAFSSVLGARA